MQLLVGAATHVGRVRAVNEDAFLSHPPYYVVADGLGGHQGGEVASRTAVDSIRARAASGAAADAGFVGELLREANRAILERAGTDPALRGMGTTCTLLAMDGSRGLIAHVGDSRGYLFRGGSLKQVTVDHTLVARMVQEGQLSEEEARIHPVRSSITRALGFDPDVEVDLEPIEAEPGDRVLLCSDGLHGMVADDVIERVLAQEPQAQRAADRLVALANDAGGDDNITVIVVDVAGVAGARDSGPTPVDDMAATRPITVAAADTQTESPEVAPDGPTDATAAARRRSGTRTALLLVLAAVVIALLALTMYLLVLPPPTGGARPV